MNFIDKFKNAFSMSEEEYLDDVDVEEDEEEEEEFGQMHEDDDDEEEHTELFIVVSEMDDMRVTKLTVLVKTAKNNEEKSDD